MSALALQALALANRHAQGAPALFDDLAARNPSGDTLYLESAGHSTSGAGAARYIADALCNEALLAAHPRFVLRCANGRIFRLLPEAGSLSVEQGGASGDGSTNDQPAIQAAIDYAHEVGARELRFESRRYRIDCPARTSHSYDTRAEDGHPIVIRASLAMRGCAPELSILDFRGLGGVDPDTNWQIVPYKQDDPSDAVWRGGGIYVQGDPSANPPNPLTVARLELDRLVLQGNRTHTGSYSWPADPVTGDGWDISDKALWVQDCMVGTIVCRDVDMIGWRGEVLYLAGVDHAVERLELTRCRLLTSNGSILNPGLNCEVMAEDCEFGDGFQAQEDTGKSRAHFRNCMWRDCSQVWLGGGHTAGVLFNATYPTRDESLPPPRTTLEHCHFEDCGTLFVQSWVRGNARLVDTQLSLSGGAAMALQDVDLAIESVIDRRANFVAAYLHGVSSLTEQVPGAPAGTYRLPPAEVRLSIRHNRSAHAVANGLESHGVEWTGFIDRSCVIEASGSFAANRTPRASSNPVSFPRVEFAGGNASGSTSAQGYYAPSALSVSGELAVRGPLMALAVSGTLGVTCSLPAYPAGGADCGFADGQSLRLVKQYGNGSITFVQGASASTALPADRTLAQAHDWIEFRYNRHLSRWEETGFGSYA